MHNPEKSIKQTAPIPIAKDLMLLLPHQVPLETIWTKIADKTTFLNTLPSQTNVDQR